MRPPESWRAAPVTLALSGLAVAAWLLALLFNVQDFAVYWGGFIPLRVAGVQGDEVLAPWWLTPVTATLIHAGAIHLVMNLIIQLFCGRAVEGIIGARQLLILYFIGAYAAAAGQYLLDPSSPTPMVGASGAISAVLGVYSLMFGRNRVKIANPTLARWVNALWLAAAYIVLQLLVGFTFETGGSRLAIGAHIGGFLAGLLLAKPLLLLRYRKA